MNTTLSRVVSIVLGVVTFFGVWASLYLFSPDKDFEMLSLVLKTLGLGLAYSLLHQKKYPIQTLSVVFVIEFLLYKIFGQNNTDESIVGTYVYGVNLIGGSIFAILGSAITNGFDRIFSPLQIRLRKENIKIGIPVIAGIIAFVICFALLAVTI